MAASLSAISSYTAKSPHRDRHMGCTHILMTRLYDEYGCERCSLCHKRPQLGWLYRCTQDWGGVLPASDFFNVQGHQKHSQDARLYSLSPSHTKGIADGHYTDQQVQILIQQKKHVRQSILGRHPSLSVTSTQSSLSSFTPSTTFSTICSSHSETDPEIFTDQLCRQPLTPIKEVRDDNIDAPYSLLADNLAAAEQGPSPCDFRVCQACRPTYRDRAWASLGTILNEHITVPHVYEFENRRLSDANLVKNIGNLGNDARDYADRYWATERVKTRKISPADFQSTVRRVLRSSQLSTLDTDFAQDRMQETALSEISLSTKDLDKNAAFAGFMRPLHLRRGFRGPMSLDLAATTSFTQKNRASGSPMLEGNSTRSPPPVTPQNVKLHDKNHSTPIPTPSSESDKKSIISRLWRSRSGDLGGGKQVSRTSSTTNDSIEDEKGNSILTRDVLAVNSELVVDRFHID